MANPQLENGHVEIANELIEHLARVNLRPYEWRVLLFVLRKTYGWKKKLDSISVSQIVTGTGLYKQHASKARKTLLEKRLLIDNGGKIGLNKDYDQWLVKRKGVTDSGDGVTGLGDAKVTDSGAKVTGTGDKTSLKQAPQKKRKKLYKRNTTARTSFSFVLRSRKRWPLPQAKLDEYKGAFSNLDVEAELRRAAQWLIDNPDRRKTAKGILRFLGGWLGRAKPRPEPKRGDLDWLPTEEEADALLKEVGL